MCSGYIGSWTCAAGCRLILRLMAAHLALSTENSNRVDAAAAEANVVSGARLTDEDVACN